MPVSFRIDEDLGLVVTVFSGKVTDGDLSEHARKLAADTRAPNFDEIVLFDESVSTSELSTDAVRRAGRYLSTRVPSGPNKLAIVAPSQVAFGMARLFAVHRDGDTGKTNLRVLRTLREAKDWLGVPSDAELSTRPPASDAC